MTIYPSLSLQAPRQYRDQDGGRRLPRHFAIRVGYRLVNRSGFAERCFVCLTPPMADWPRRRGLGQRLARQVLQRRIDDLWVRMERRESRDKIINTSYPLSWI